MPVHTKFEQQRLWTLQSNFATDVGPFQQKYLALCQEIHGVYDNAKEFHAKGIEMLVKVRLQLSAWAVMQHQMPLDAKA